MTGMDATAWDARYREQELVWSKGPNTFVVDEITGMRPGRALDLAGGEGRNAIWLAQQGWDVELVEFSSVALAKAASLAEHAGVTVERTLGDLTGDLEVGPADLVLVAYLQLPRAQSRRALQLAASLVAPGGTLLFIAHTARNLVDGVGGPQDLDVLPTSEQARDDLAGTGLVITRAEEVTRSVATDAGERHAIDVLVRATRPEA